LRQAHLLGIQRSASHKHASLGGLLGGEVLPDLRRRHGSRALQAARALRVGHGFFGGSFGLGQAGLHLRQFGTQGV